MDNMTVTVITGFVLSIIISIFAGMFLFAHMYTVSILLSGLSMTTFIVIGFYSTTRK